MRIQYQILLFLACLNLSIGMVIALALPGTVYHQPASFGGNVTEYEQRFNATDVAEKWKATPFTGIPVVGDIFSGFYLFFSQIRFLIDGFPTLLTWISDAYITSEAGRTAFTVIANALRAVFALVLAFFVVEFITGRVLSE